MEKREALDDRITNMLLCVLLLEIRGCLMFLCEVRGGLFWAQYMRRKTRFCCLILMMTIRIELSPTGVRTCSHRGEIIVRNAIPLAMAEYRLFQRSDLVGRCQSH